MPVSLNKRTVKDIPHDTRQALFPLNTLTEPFRLLTTKDAAHVLGLSPAMLERMRWMREGPAFVRPTGSGRVIRYRWRDLLDWIERNRIDPGKPE